MPVRVGRRDDVDDRGRARHGHRERPGRAPSPKPIDDEVRHHDHSTELAACRRDSAGIRKRLAAQTTSTLLGELRHGTAATRSMSRAIRHRSHEPALVKRPVDADAGRGQRDRQTVGWADAIGVVGGERAAEGGRRSPTAKLGAIITGGSGFLGLTALRRHGHLVRSSTRRTRAASSRPGSGRRQEITEWTGSRTAPACDRLVDGEQP